MEEVGIAIRTVWGLLVQKCYIQLQNVVLKPRMFSFPISLIWEIALNAEVNTKKQHFDAAFLMFKVSEDWVEGCGYGILCGSDGSESVLVKVWLFSHKKHI